MVKVGESCEKFMTAQVHARQLSLISPRMSNQRAIYIWERVSDICGESAEKVKLFSCCLLQRRFNAKLSGISADLKYALLVHDVQQVRGKNYPAWQQVGRRKSITFPFACFFLPTFTP